VATSSEAWSWRSAWPGCGPPRERTRHLKLVGAAYLVFLGVQALRAAKRGDRVAFGGGGHAVRSSALAFRRGLASDLFNVKVGALLDRPGAAVRRKPSGAAACDGGRDGDAGVRMAERARALATRVSRTVERRCAARGLNGTVAAVVVALGARLGRAH
jgi:hypothetical protein